MNIMDAIASQVPKEVLETGYFEYIIVIDDGTRIPIPAHQVTKALESFGDDSRIFRRFVTKHYQITEV